MQARIDGTELVTRQSFRQRIFEAWQHRCAYCGDHAQSLDHVLPKARGGLTVARNLAPACLPCNSSKSADDWISWFRRQAFWTAEQEQQITAWIGSHPDTGQLGEVAQPSLQESPSPSCTADTASLEPRRSDGNDQSPQTSFGERFRLKAQDQPGRWRKGLFAA
jgi:hypothetical protein